MNRRKLLIAAVSAIAITGGLFATQSSFNTSGILGASAQAQTSQTQTQQAAKTLDVLKQETSARWAKLGFKTQTISANGVDLHVATAGSGPALVLLHGYPQSGEIWRDIAQELAKTRTVIIPDLRGFGLSGVAQSGYDLATVSEDIHQLVRALGHNKVEVVAHDWGGAVGAIYALRHRTVVTKLAFIESAVAGLGFEEVWNFSKPNPAMTFIPFLLSGQLTEDLIIGREDIFLRHLWSTFTSNKEALPFAEWQPYVDAMKRPGLIQASASYYRAVYGQVEANRALIAQGKLTIPVLSISGKASFGDFQKGFVEAFAGNLVKHATIDGAGHFVAEEQPEALMKELRPFLAK
jgi:pimeloyl-ACP methyl ester carboxylesterase